MMTTPQMKRYLVFYSEWASPGWYHTVHEFEARPEPKAIIKALADVVPIYHVDPSLEIREIGNSWTGKELMTLAGLEVRDGEVVEMEAS